MKSICVFCTFFASCIALTASGVISEREDAGRENLRKLALANNELAFNLHRRLVSASTENIFFSPLSISAAFGMLFYGARGETAKELREALGYERAGLPTDVVHNTFNHYLRKVLRRRPQQRVHNTFNHYLRKVLRRNDSPDGYILNAANAVLVDKRFQLLDEYRRNVQELYGAAVRDVDFAREAPRVVEEINDWVKEKTNGKIDKLLDELSPDIILFLLNAVYFKGTWKTPFKPEKTRNEIFYNNGLESEKRSVPLMHMISKFPFGFFEDFKALELPYNGKNVSMLILLPKKRDGLRALEESLTPEKLEEVQRRLYKNKVDVWLPKFKLQFEKELSAEIQALGANQIFRNGADFSGMTSSKNVAVSQIVHKAVIEVNEEGSEAAGGAGTGLIPRVMPLEFRVDHPFLFVIMEKSSNMILFVGRVNNL